MQKKIMVFGGSDILLGALTGHELTQVSLDEAEAMQEEFRYETQYAITPQHHTTPLEYSITDPRKISFKTHGGHSTPSKSGHSPKQIKANRKKNKNARKARKISNK